MSIPDPSDCNDYEPFAYFTTWLSLAKACPDISDPYSMCLATSNSQGFPSCRIVTLKSFDKDSGFKLCTNYNSRKGKDLSENPRAALHFDWSPIKKRIIVKGHVQKLSDDESTLYFHERPLNAQITSLISKNTSNPIPSREDIEKKERSFLQKYMQTGVNELVPKPSNWGGYVVIPETIEFRTGTVGFKFRKSSSHRSSDIREKNNWIYEEYREK